MGWTTCFGSIKERAMAIIIAIIPFVFVTSTLTADEEDEAPWNIIVFATGPGTMSINWSHTQSGLSHFAVIRENPYRRIEPIPRDQFNYPDWGLSPSTTYRYKVCAIFYDGGEACNGDWIDATTQDPPQPTTPPTPPPHSTPPVSDFYPTLTAKPGGGAQVYLNWSGPPGGSLRMTSVKLYKNGKFIYEALQPGNLDLDHADLVAPNSVHRYQVCYEGPDIGERCSLEVLGKPEPVVPSAPADVTVERTLRPGGRTPGGIVLRPRRFISVRWRNTEIPGEYLVVEREDKRVSSNPDPASPVRVIIRTFWKELGRVATDARPSASFDEAEPGHVGGPLGRAGNTYRVCAIVPLLGESGKVCSAPVSLPE